jgi:hypothetical protein
VLAFGKEDLSMLTDKHYEYFIKKGFMSVPEMIKFVHFNENYPENHKQKLVF